MQMKRISEREVALERENAALRALLREWRSGLLDLEERCYNSRSDISTTCRLLLNKLDAQCELTIVG